MYSHETNFNLEHFLIPDQRAAKIRWYIDDTQYFNIQIDIEFAKKNKRKTCNLLIIDHDLNERLDNYDIVKKIEMIQSWHAARGLALPAHVNTVFSFIQEMPEYRILQQHKNNGIDENIIRIDYQSFLQSYFEEERGDSLLSKLKEQFQAAFQN